MRAWASLLLLLAAVLLYCKAHEGLDYGLVIDMGSSGSRIHIYSWPHRDDDIELPVVTEIPPTDKTDEGIAKYPTPAAAAESLKPLLAYAETRVPPRSHGDTPIFAFATAGMRVIPLDKQTAILDAIRDTIKEFPFQLDDPLQQVKVINGSTEGLFAWMTVNFLGGVFTGGPNTPTRGSLDMGGASTQIVFQVGANKLPDLPDRYAMDVVLNQRDYHLYSHSYLGYGSDLSRDRLWQILADQHPGEDKIMSGCLPTGNETHVMVGSRMITFVGTSDWNACLQEVTPVLNGTSCPCPQLGCAYDHQCQPKPPVGDFMAFSGFKYLIQVLPVTENATLAEIKAAAVGWCAQSFAELEQKWKSNKGVWPYVTEYCYDAAYYVQILEAYGFQDDSKQIMYRGDVGGISVGWALGAMLWEANLISTDRKNHLVLIVSIVVGVAAVLLVLVALIVRFVHERRRSSYDPLPSQPYT